MPAFYNVAFKIETNFQATNVIKPIMKTRKVNIKR